MNEFTDQFKEFDIITIKKNNDPNAKSRIKIVQNFEEYNEKVKKILAKSIIERIKSCLVDVENLGTKIE